jgi:hypothetical protein
LVCNRARLGKTSDVRICRDRLLTDLDDLATFGANADGGVDRTSFSPADLAARRWLTQRCDDAGLTLRSDGIGNLFARLGDQQGPAVWTGSHLDSVPNGGRFDGALGVLCSLEALRTIADSAMALSAAAATGGVRRRGGLLLPSARVLRPGPRFRRRRSGGDGRTRWTTADRCPSLGRHRPGAGDDHHR